MSGLKMKNRQNKTAFMAIVAVLALVALPVVTVVQHASALSQLTVTSNSGSVSGGETVTVTGGAKVRFAQVSMADYHTLALASDGTVYAWGWNSDGQLGNGSSISSLVPIAVTTAGTPMAGKTIVQVAAGDSFSLALASDGTVYSWGENGAGKLGDGSGNDSDVPVAVTTAGTPMAGKTITQIAAGEETALALASDGTVYGWGDNFASQLGNASNSDAPVPVAVTTAGTPMAGKTIKQVAVGDSYSLVLATDGTMYAWGDNSYGGLGDSSTNNTNVPVAVVVAGTPLAGKTVTQVAAGFGTSVALASDGTVYTWGLNDYGELGNGTTGSNSSVPVAVTTAGTPMAGKVISQVSSQNEFSIAVATDGTVYGWGANGDGQLGDNTNNDSNVPVAVTTAGTPMAGKAIEATGTGANAEFSVVVASDGTAYAWGANDSDGELGNGSTTPSSVPVAVTMPVNLTPVSVTLGGTLATNLQVTGGGDVTFTAPAHAAGVVDVVITYSNGASQSVLGAYTYVAAQSGGGAGTGTGSSGDETESAVPGAPNTGILAVSTKAGGINLGAIAAAVIGAATTLAAAGVVWAVRRAKLEQ